MDYIKTGDNIYYKKHFKNLEKMLEANKNNDTPLFLSLNSIEHKEFCNFLQINFALSSL